MSLAKYLFIAMVSWLSPAKQPESLEVSTARYESIAADVAEVVSREDEPALFKNDTDKTKTALLLISMAYFESSYFARVDEGHCLPKECDGGLAFSMWQFHPEMGLAFDGDKWKYDANGWHGKDFIADRKLTIRMVLHLLRGPHTSGWGEGKRKEKAMTYFSKNPR
jgi:hypothetical protein